MSLTDGLNAECTNCLKSLKRQNSLKSLNE